MDPTPNADQPINPADAKSPETPPKNKTWFEENRSSLFMAVVGIALVFWFLNPLDVLLVVLGLGGIVFLHELGHFLAAKACDVHVKTFSIGFGPPLPFCSFQYGETYYKLAMIPLGGYVAMVGQSEEGETEEEMEKSKEDPRSYRNKSVLQRMLIISAGVIMNVILGAVCFILAYMNGVEEQPAIVAGIDPGSAAWRAGLRTGETITAIDTMENPWFADIYPIVSGTSSGEQLTFKTQYQGKESTYNLEPIRAEGALFPQVGVAPPSSVTFLSLKRDSTPPYRPGSPVARAKDSAGNSFQPGDRIIATTNPYQPGANLLPLDQDTGGLPIANLVLQQRLNLLAGKDVTVEVDRGDGSKVRFVIPANFRKETGAIMKMGPIVALRADSAAAKTGIIAQVTDREKVTISGDILTMVEVAEVDGSTTVYSIDPRETPKGPNTVLKTLDPLRLPYDLNLWARRWTSQPSPNRTVTLTVLRKLDHTQQPVKLSLMWDPTYEDTLDLLAHPSTPVSLGGLGLAYQVLAEVQSVVPGSAAEKAGVRPNDQYKRIRVQAQNHDGSIAEGRFTDIKALHHWAYADQVIQHQAPYTYDVTLQRGEEQIEVKLAATVPAVDPCPLACEGFIFKKELQRQTAGSIGEALQMGARRTMRAIKSTYLGLYSLVFGRTSLMLISGPITLARASYVLAGEDIWKLVLLVALISINLAVVNFLPIPVLDGGHMVFLFYEWIRRKPPPVFLHNILTIIGLVMVLSLMLFAVGLDIWRLIFQG